MGPGIAAMIVGAIIMFACSGRPGTDLTEGTVAVIGAVIFAVGTVCATARAR